MSDKEKKYKSDLVREGLCLNCKNPVGNDVFTVCDDCWDKYLLKSVLSKEEAKAENVVDQIKNSTSLEAIFHLNQYVKHQMSKELEEAEKEFNKWFPTPGKERYGFVWLLIRLKKKIG